MTPAEAIKNARLAAGLTVKQLAAKIGVAPFQIYRWEWVGPPVPRPEMMRKIVDATGQPIRVDY